MCRLHATDAFGVPQVFFNSGDGIDEQDVFPVSVEAMRTRTGRSPHLVSTR